MEDDKLSAYYDELTQKGGGAARFKQGLGFSSTTSTNNATTSSFLSSFVKASSPTTSSSFQKQAELESIQNKLNKAPNEKPPNRDESNRNSSRRSPDRDKTLHRHSRHWSRSRSRSRSPVRYSKRRSRSRSPDGYSRRRHRSRDRRSKRRSRSRSPDDFRSRRKHQSRSMSRERDKERSKRRSRSRLPGKRRSENGKKHGEKKNQGGDRGRTDYAKLIEGYDKMTPAERVKGKMKLQLSQTVEKDETMASGSGWERFEFDKDAPLDDEEIEAVEDDAALVKNLGQSFRFSAVEAKREEDIRAAHDEAMFGASSVPPQAAHDEAMFGASSVPPHAETDDEEEEASNTEEKVESSPVQGLLSDQVKAMQQGSWRDRLKKSS